MKLDIDRYVADLVQRHPPFAADLEFVRSALAKPQSELEKVFVILWTFYHSRRGRYDFITYAGKPLPSAAPTPAPAKLDLSSQVKIGQHRVDFLATVTLPGRAIMPIVIECDGHAFHDRTPEQASADRARDRALLRQGYVTLRYTYDDIMRRRGAIEDLWGTIIDYSRACRPEEKP